MDTGEQSKKRPAAPPRRRRNEQDTYAGERLRVARQLAGLSQQQLGEHLGVSFQAVQKYESGENRLSAGRLVRAAEVLGIDLAFFAKDTSVPRGDTAQMSGFTGDEIELVRAYRALRSDALRTQLRRLVTTMSSGAAEEEQAKR
jgi:transcriptional regulator with XRE-family HTH domain